MKRILSVILTLALLGSLLVVPAFAANETVTLPEDWRLTSDLDLNVPAGETLTIDGQGKYHIYEMGGKLKNSGGGTVTFAEGTTLYPAAGDEDAARFTPNGIWDTGESNALMALRTGGYYGVKIEPTTGGTVIVNKLVVKKDEQVIVTATPNSGYQFSTLSVTYGSGNPVTVNNNTFTMPASDVTITAAFVIRTGGGGGGSSSGSTTTETTKNPDGSTTTTVTNKTTGTVTETTKYPDGSSEVVETKKDGTVTTTSTDSDGNKTQTVENPDGTSETTVTIQDGSTSTTKVDVDGKTETVVKLPASVVADAADKGEAVSLPMPEVAATSDSASAPTMTVNLPSGERAKVEIPVADVTSGTVAVLVNEDGTETVIKTSIPTGDSVIVTLSDGDTVKIVDNSKTFADVPAAYWGADAVAFATSHELFAGTSDTTFEPETAMNRAMIVTVLARLDGVNTSTGETWYAAGRDWAMKNGISDGTDMNGTLTREQLVAMLYRYAGSPTVTADLSSYTDRDSVSDWAQAAMAWAVDQGIIAGITSTTLSPQGQATRAQVAAILQRYIAA